ncbi:MAG: hypothetical protein AAGH92_03420 [Planctomycetota bacterium]
MDFFAKSFGAFAWILRFAVGFAAAVLLFFLLLSVLIQLFDAKGGEPGSRVVFGSVLFWPVILVLAIGLGLGSATSRKYCWFSLGIAVLSLAIIPLLRLIHS